MRILPADAVDATALLAEIEQAGAVKCYEIGGKPFGAVRNFCQFQRPKKPNSVHPQTDEIRQWVNIDARSTRDGSEQVGKQLPTGGEKSRQMEDGGGKGISSEANASGGEPPADPIKEVFDLGVALLVAGGRTESQSRSLIGKWRKATGSDAAVLDGLLDCRARSISDPVEWLEKRFKPAKWVSASGYEYRGSDQDVLREAERRGDMSTYWSVKSAMKNAPPPERKGSGAKRGKSSSIGQLMAGFLQAGAST